MNRLILLTALTLGASATAQTFDPIADVLLHPRCANCHVGADGIPLWSTDTGGTRHHGYHVQAGESRMGIETLPCSTCHSEQNGVLEGSAPGAEGWALPPPEMQWATRTPTEICEQLKDPERNGGRTLDEVADHIVHDPLVIWGWEPGPGRQPAPGTPEKAAAAILAWADAGAPCS
ncbi:hypothetical protein SAMN05444004_10719 [Jannaschia faecimaris]|uniref:Cytochrome c domain-containing protein n=1 Tax=Jannaschia faecimaris TaxID=1244108 RepID=A0A1H3QV41_9RHOB|nr:hypothetical protein [Jannaschia faecimaris]SDZ16941.1 hypothetical protein SAMN05444004_10719 [Jannaschia faecimaris]